MTKKWICKYTYIPWWGPSEWGIFPPVVSCTCRWYTAIFPRRCPYPGQSGWQILSAWIAGSPGPCAWRNRGSSHGKHTCYQQNQNKEVTTAPTACFTVTSQLVYTDYVLSTEVSMQQFENSNEKLCCLLTFSVSFVKYIRHRMSSSSLSK